MPILLTDFYKQFANYGSYDNIRSLASYIDGLKITARKVIYVVRDMPMGSKTKVDRLAAKVGEATCYIHGDTSIEGVIVNLARKYAGVNNVNTLLNAGTFGTSLEPTAGASRYIKSGPTEILNLIYKKDDDLILENLYMENSKIEYKYFMPTIPMLLVNGATGISIGWSQLILPRNPFDIIDYIKHLLGEKKSDTMPTILPYFDGWGGRIVPDGYNSYRMYGSYEKKRKTITINELPIGYTQKSYNALMHKLEDKNSKQNAKLKTPIVLHYDDLCDTKKDKFKFRIRISDEKHIPKLGVEGKISEVFTTMDENNKIITFNNAHEIVRSFLNVKLNGIKMRKAAQLKEILKKLKLLLSKYTFIRGVLDGDIVINNKKKVEIIEQFGNFDKIIENEGNYEYLLKLPLYSLTNEQIIKLTNSIKVAKQEYQVLNQKSIKSIYLDDLDELEKGLRKRGLR